VFALSLALSVGALSFGPAEQEAHAQRSRPLTKKERQKRKEQEEAAKKEQEKKDQEAAAAAEEDEKKKKAAASASAQPAAPPPPKREEWDDTVEAAKAIFVTADLGYTRADMSTLAASSMAFDTGSANGLLLGLTGGLRLKDWQYGLKYRVHDASNFTLWSFNASIAYALKPRPVTPIIEGHLGYVFDQSIDRKVFESSLPAGTILPPDVNVKGLIVGGEASANYWLTSWFRVGAFLGLDFMFLSRERAPTPQSTFGPNQEFNAKPLYSDSGFGVGVNINAGIRGSFEIGIE
jgi:hypothetical protein